MRHFETLRYRVRPPEMTEVIMALLAEEGFDGFLEEGKGWIVASRLLKKGAESKISELIHALPAELEWTSECTPEQNWNVAWESSYPMLDIGDAIRIRAPFHEKNKSNREEFELEPDMSFGTGHHPTTFLMAEALHTRSAGKTCLDFGTGTGILAMIMLRFGASHVTAVDNDERAVKTAKRHIESEKSGSGRFHIVCSSNLPNGRFDLIAANIHLNVINEKLPEMFRLLNPDGEILISGILENQVQTLMQVAENCGFLITFKQIKEGWVCLALQKRN